ncbi:transporter, drug/metabolite exporter family [Paraglaciecola sp. T6c]|uniref:DMT family transporter n=1 Tax=Pseudoalteromonas atlantica (strain T6c / ATCC BAA-1087) TaxID=3042615 RepID=UPI0000DA6E8A|nr:DMT family transporter [Paraglaciecola sp. T6c]ABG42338.1 transporter, drug/metabolite exporter family [Paraglaciecola sp. T6c]
MSLWIPFTVMAAFMQSWRNAFQKRLSADVDTLGVTLARFILAVPMAALYAFVLFSIEDSAVPQMNPKFYLAIVLAAISQIFATALMVKLFRLRNYAMGVGLAKSEAVIAAILGALLFAAPLSAMAWCGVIIGGMAVWLMSVPKGMRDISWPTLLIGLASGLCFALTTLWVREASLMTQLPFLQSAAYVLFWVLLIQTLILLLWLLIRSPQTLRALCLKPKLVFIISFCSFVGSIGWFTAMSLETVALVKTLGQIEIFFTLLISAKWFKERLQRSDKWGLGLILVGAVLVILA